MYVQSFNIWWNQEDKLYYQWNWSSDVHAAFSPGCLVKWRFPFPEGKQIVFFFLLISLDSVFWPACLTLIPFDKRALLSCMLKLLDRSTWHAMTKLNKQLFKCHVSLHFSICLITRFHNITSVMIFGGFCWAPTSGFFFLKINMKIAYIPSFCGCRKGLNNLLSCMWKAN